MTNQLSGLCIQYLYMPLSSCHAKCTIKYSMYIHVHVHIMPVYLIYILHSVHFLCVCTCTYTCVIDVKVIGQDYDYVVHRCWPPVP